MVSAKRRERRGKSQNVAEGGGTRRGTLQNEMERCAERPLLTAEHRGKRRGTSRNEARNDARNDACSPQNVAERGVKRRRRKCGTMRGTTLAHRRTSPNPSKSR